MSVVGVRPWWVLVTSMYPASSSLRRCTERFPAVIDRISCSRGNVSRSPSASAERVAMTRSLAWAWITGSSGSLIGLHACVGDGAGDEHAATASEGYHERVPARPKDDADDIDGADPRAQDREVTGTPDGGARKVHGTDEADRERGPEQSDQVGRKFVGDSPGGDGDAGEAEEPGESVEHPLGLRRAPDVSSVAGAGDTRD